LGTNRMTRVGNVIGTLEYMSPEQVRGLETDARSDVYGLGIMLYEMLTGRLPFESENDFEVMKMQTEMMPTPPRSLKPDIPVEVEAAIMKAVAKDPNDRFQSAGDFLETFLELGFALPNVTFGFGTLANFKKPSRPSNPGLPTGGTSQTYNDIANSIPQSQIPTEPIISIPKSEMPATLEVGEELKKAAAGETRLAPVQQNEIKGTRIATNPHEMKATRLGEARTDEVSSGNYQAASSPSFFSKLTGVHYAIASAVALVFFGLVGMAIILPSLWSSFSTVKEEPKKVEQPKAIENKKVETTPTATPEIVSQPTTPPTSQPESFPTSTPLPMNNAPVLTENPNTEKPNNPPTQNQPRERETVKNNPPPAQKQQPRQSSPPSAPKQQPQQTPKGGKRLRDILTEN
ncbi:MAG TPA: protein kinase, partial [Pyrinomonadaceae bacterium]|nr:protein kinase [Pyrinomonadaceae bacterium]